MIWVLLWLLIGYATVAYVARNDIKANKEITVDYLTLMIGIGLLGPLVTCIVIIIIIIEFYEKYGDTVIFRKKEK